MTALSSSRIELVPVPLLQTSNSLTKAKAKSSSSSSFSAPFKDPAHTTAGSNLKPTLPLTETTKTNLVINIDSDNDDDEMPDALMEHSYWTANW